MSTVRRLGRTDLPVDTRRTVESFERAYDTYFSHLLHFGSRTLESLHMPGPLPANVRVASVTDPRVAEHLATVTTVANLPEPTPADRDRYVRALTDIYGLLPLPAAHKMSAPGTTVLAPEREGRDLAERLGVMPRHQGWTPQAKRIRVADGLLVGVDASLPARTGRLLIVDGVVASGVTLMAMMRLTVRPGALVEIFTCHSTRQGALALVRYAEHLRVALTLHVGHVSGVLNENFYAVAPDDPQHVLLGDVGDTISHTAPSWHGGTRT